MQISQQSVQRGANDGVEATTDPVAVPRSPLSDEQAKAVHEQKVLSVELAECFRSRNLDFFKAKALYNELIRKIEKCKSEGNPSLEDLEPKFIERLREGGEGMLALSRNQHLLIGTFFSVPKNLIEMTNRTNDEIIALGKEQVVDQVFAEFESIPQSFETRDRTIARLPNGERLDTFMTEFRAFSVLQNVADNWFVVAGEFKAKDDPLLAREGILKAEERKLREVTFKGLTQAELDSQEAYRKITEHLEKCRNDLATLYEKYELVMEVHWRAMLAVPEAIAERMQVFCQRSLDEGTGTRPPLSAGGRQALVAYFASEEVGLRADPAFERMRRWVEPLLAADAPGAGVPTQADAAEAMQYLASLEAELQPLERLLQHLSFQTVLADGMAVLAAGLLQEGTAELPRVSRRQREAILAELGGEAEILKSTDRGTIAFYQALQALMLVEGRDTEAFTDSDREIANKFIAKYRTLTATHEEVLAGLNGQAFLSVEQAVPKDDPIGLYGEPAQKRLRELLRSRYASPESVEQLLQAVQVLEEQYPSHEFSLDIQRLEEDMARQHSRYRRVGR